MLTFIYDPNPEWYAVFLYFIQNGCQGRCLMLLVRRNRIIRRPKMTFSFLVLSTLCVTL